MKKIFLLAFFVLFIYSEGFSNPDDWRFVDTLHVGKRPTAVFSSGTTEIYIYCAGYDENHNGILDDGDEAPSIWAMNADGAIYDIVIQSLGDDYIRYMEPVKVLDLEFEDVSLPANVSYLFGNKTNVSIYISSERGVTEVNINQTYDYINFTDMKFEVSERKIVNEATISTSVARVDKNKSLLYISQVNKEENTGDVIVYNLTKDEFVDTIRVTSDLIATTKLNDDNILILNQKSDLNENANFMIYDLDPDSKNGKYQLVSITPLDFNPYKVYSERGGPYNFIISSIDTNMFRVYNLKLQYQDYTPDDECNEIREVLPSSNMSQKYYATSYDGYVYMFQYYPHKEEPYVGKLRAYGKGEGINVAYNSLIVATPYAEDSFEVINTIPLYGFRPVSVNDDNTNNNIIIYPNPASDFITINEENLINHYEIYSVLGDKIMISESNTIDISKLAKGMYYIKSNYKFYPFVKK